MRYGTLVWLVGTLIAAALIGVSAPASTRAAEVPSTSPPFEQNGISHMPGAPTPQPPPTKQKLTLMPVFTWTAIKRVSRGTWTPIVDLPCYMAPPASFPGAEVVGYDDDVERCPLDDYVYQTALKFDLSPLKQHQQVAITHVYLKYGESVIAQRLGNGRAPGGAGFTSCGSAIGVPDNNDWTSGSYRGLIGKTDAPIDDNSSPGDWNVTTLVYRWFIYGGDTGLVIRGDNESFPENDAACVSFLNNFKL